MEGKGKNSEREIRIQSGSIHVCTRGNGRRVIFLDREDRADRQSCTSSPKDNKSYFYDYLVVKRVLILAQQEIRLL